LTSEQKRTRPYGLGVQRGYSPFFMRDREFPARFRHGGALILWHVRTTTSSAGGPRQRVLEAAVKSPSHS
jgi:hypothetical protein